LALGLSYLWRKKVLGEQFLWGVHRSLGRREGLVWIHGGTLFLL
jgi:hypothetical protein